MAAIAVAVLCASAAPASADWLFTPYLGMTFGMSTTFIDLEGAEGSKQLLFGGSAAWLPRNTVFGVEGDVGYAPRFFETDNRGGLVLGSNMTTVMGNVIAAAPLSVTRESLRPYVLAGAGLVHAGIDDVSGLATTHANLAGLAIGGGAIGFITPKTGVRFDLRQIRTFSREDDPVTRIRSSRLRFWRATFGITIQY